MKRLTLPLVAAVAFAACEMPIEPLSDLPVQHAPAFDLHADPSLAGHWNFDEGSGIVAADASGNGNSGTLINGPTWVPGHTGTALSFDGVDDHVLVSDNAALNLAGDFTISMGAKWTNFIDDADLMRKGSPYTAVASYKIEAKDNLIRVRLVGTQRSITLKDNVTNRNDGIWHHIAVVREGSVSRLYVDGVQVAYKSRGVGDLSNSANLAFGAKDTGTDDFFDGSIDDIRIYTRALTTQEISQLVNAGG